MRIITASLIVLIFSILGLTAGTEKQTKSEITFKGFGKYSIEETVKIIIDKKRTDSKTDFKGEGLLGGTVAKLILKSGEEGEIIDLPAMSILKMDHKKKEYAVFPIEKIDMDKVSDVSESEKSTENKEEEKSKSDIRIIRNEFKVTDTGEEQKVNNFPCKKYNILWLTEWESMSSEQKGTDSLSTDVWTTKTTADMLEAQETEFAFNKEYMSKIGINLDQIQQTMLGMNWLSILNQLNQSPNNPKMDETNMAQEMKKIEGYPILIDGKYYAIRPNQAEESTVEEPETPSPKKMFGGLAKNLLKKKTDKPSQLEPSFSYLVETKAYKSTNIENGDFNVPSNYKKK
jgi:hypothetical protein